MFVAVFAIRCRTYMNASSPLVLVLTDSMLAILLATALSFVTYPLERAVMKLWYKLASKISTY